MNWDDDKNILKNEYFRGLGPSHFRWMFTTFYLGPYQPLAWVTFGADYLMWGLQPFGYHLTNIVLHAVAAGLLSALAGRLLAMRRGSPSGSAIWLGAAVALFWAVHPLRVEAVTWVTERREVLCAVLSLASLHLCLSQRRGAALLVAVSAMLAKGVAVVLPVLFILMEVYRVRASGGAAGPALLAAIWRHANALGAAALFAVIAFAGQRVAGATMGTHTLWLEDRLTLSAHGLGFYVAKTIWPARLAPLYEIPFVSGPPERADASELIAPAIGYATAFALGAVVFFLIRRRALVPLLLLTAYVAIVLPVSGLFQAGAQVAADRYAYQCGWVVAIALALAIEAAFSRGFGSGAARALTAAVLVVAAAILIPRTISQQRIWRDSHSLWTHLLALYPRSATGHYNLGCEFAQLEDHDAALKEYRAALAIRPNYPEAQNNLAESAQWLAGAGRTAEAEAAFREAIRYQPGFVEAHANLGILLLGTGRVQEAVAECEIAARLKPGDAEIVSNLGCALLALGRNEEAAQRLREAVRLRQDVPAFHFNLGTALQRLARYEGAAAAFRATLTLNPSDGGAHVSLAEVLQAQGKEAEAFEHLQLAIRLDPGDVAAHHSVGLALARRGDDAGAIREFNEALRLEPRFVDGWIALGHTHRRQGRTEDAVRCWREALRLAPNNTAADAALRQATESRPVP